MGRDAEAESDFKKAFELDAALRKTFEPLIKQAKAKRQDQPAAKPETRTANPFEEALRLQKAGRHKESISYYDEALKLNPRMDEAYYRRGLAYSNLSQYQRAIQDFDETIRINPRSASAYSNRGGAYNMLGQQQRAIQDYDAALRIDPQYARAYAGRGISLLNLRRDAEAESDFKKAVELDPALKKSFEPLINEAKAKRKN